MKQFVLIFLLILPTGNNVHGETIAGLILARGGSKGVHLKNLRTVGGVSLLARAIRAAYQSGIDDITVSTDHPLIALEALKYSAKVFQRCRVTATDWAPSIWGAQEFLATRKDVTMLMLIQSTSPFIKQESLREAVRLMQEPALYDCTFSVMRSHKFRWINRENILVPINFELHDRPRRQDWNGELLETGSFYLTRRNLLLAGFFQNDK